MNREPRQSALFPNYHSLRNITNQFDEIKINSPRLFQIPLWRGHPIPRFISTFIISISRSKSTAIKFKLSRWNLLVEKTAGLEALAIKPISWLHKCFWTVTAWMGWLLSIYVLIIGYWFQSETWNPHRSRWPSAGWHVEDLSLTDVNKMADD